MVLLKIISDYATNEVFVNYISGRTQSINKSIQCKFENISALSTLKYEQKPQKVAQRIDPETKTLLEMEIIKAKIPEYRSVKFCNSLKTAL